MNNEQEFWSAHINKENNVVNWICSVKLLQRSIDKIWFYIYDDIQSAYDFS